MIGHSAAPPNNLHLNARFKKRPEGAWVKKPEAELTTIRKQIQKSTYSIKGPFITSIVLMPFSFIIDTTLPFGMNLIIFFALSFIGIFIYQIIQGRSFVKAPNFKICNKCLREDLLNIKKCWCGGIFEPPEFYNFLPKDSDTESQI